MKPPFSITSEILTLISQIERLIGRLESFDHPKPQPKLRKSNRVKTLQGSLAIEGNSLDLEQVTAILDGKKVIAPQNDIIEILNANEVYETLTELDHKSSKDLLKTHDIMMKSILPDAGQWRNSNVGIMKQGAVSHLAPPPDRVPFLMDDLFQFFKGNEGSVIENLLEVFTFDTHRGNHFMSIS